MSFYKFNGVIPPVRVPREAFNARALCAARRRVDVARERANRLATEDNLTTVAELEAGLKRLEAAK